MKYFLACLVGVLVSMAALAKDDPVTIDDKHILVTDASEPGFFNGPVHSAMFNGGGV